MLIYENAAKCFEGIKARSRYVISKVVNALPKKESKGRDKGTGSKESAVSSSGGGGGGDDGHEREVLPFERGDLILLEINYASAVALAAPRPLLSKGSPTSLPGPGGSNAAGGYGAAKGVHERTSAKGSFPLAKVFIIPCLSRPSVELVQLYVRLNHTCCIKSVFLKWFCLFLFSWWCYQ